MKIQKQPDYLIFADSAKKGENAEFPDISRGWGITIEQTASKPPMEWMNGAFNRVDKNMLYLLQQGVPEWNEKVIYPVNAIIKYNGVLYTAIAENDNTKPSINTTKWKKTQAEVQDASTAQKGIVKLNSAIDSDSQTEAATPSAVKKVNDSAVKKSGDTLTGNLNINNGDSSAISLKNNKNDEWMLRIHADGSFSIFNKNSDEKWISKFRNEATANTWRFENTADVTIAGKSILKTGDYGVGAQTGTSVQNLDEHLNSGFYGTNTAKIPNLPFTGGGSASSLLVLPSESPYWKVEQLSVVNGRIPKIYYRTDTKNDGKQTWYEAITAANVGEYTHPFKGDLANKSLNDFTGTDTGNYFQGRNILATSENGYPVNQAGTLTVMKNGADGAGCCQIYTMYRSARQFIRNYRGGTKTWEPWVEQITTANINEYLPAGIPQPWPLSTPPNGWFECNGSPFNTSWYPKLAVLYPRGRLPDLRGEFIRGWDNGRGVDSGRNILSWQDHQLAAHRHVGGWGENITGLNAENRQRAAPFGCTGESGNWVGSTNNDNDNPLFYTNDGTNGARTNPKGITSWFDLNPNGLVGNETHPRNVAFMYIVKAE